MNPTWDVIELDEPTLRTYIDVSSDIPNFDKISKAAQSDIIRVFLLKQYGGVWVDATTYCNIPLDAWLDDMMAQGFFAFNKPGPGRMVASWFLAASKENYIVQRWYERTIDYWKKRKKTDRYFWFHFLFNDLYRKDEQFKTNWNQVPKLSAAGPHALIRYGLWKPIPKRLRQLIDSNQVPLFKLTYKNTLKKSSSRLGLIKYVINLAIMKISDLSGHSVLYYLLAKHKS